MKKSPIQSRIEDLAQTFARDVLAALSGLVSELAGTNGVAEGPHRAAANSGGRRRRGRRSGAETTAVAAKIAAFVKGQPKGAKIDAIGQALKMTTSALSLPIKKALATKAIRKTGQRRATRYLPAR